MRILAVARYRFWTTLRSAAPIFGLAAGMPFAGTLFEALSWRLVDVDASMLAAHAGFAIIVWTVHGAILIGASELFGNVKASRSDLTSAISDLMDSAPIQPRVRFAGECLGIFGTTLMIHLCCLPGLAMTAALSPLPAIVFGSIEAAMIPLMILASASAAWRRLAPRTRWSGTRSARSGLLFIILALLIVFGTTSQPAFRDSLVAFIGSPSMRKWQFVAASVDNPFLLIFLLAMLYSAYFAFFYLSGTRDRAALGDIA
jgi:hypothetical protein